MSTALQHGAKLTKRDGSISSGPAMTFSPPFWIFQNGSAVKNYGNDEAAAFEHYDRLVSERWGAQLRYVSTLEG